MIRMAKFARSSWDDLLNEYSGQVDCGRLHLLVLKSYIPGYNE